MRAASYKCYNSECKYYWGEACRASADVTLTCIGRIVHKKTNADHIRSMTDEELAEFIADFWFCRRYCPERNRVENELFIVQGCDGECERHSFDWLKQPYKEEI